jgi:hypothetical protein
MKTGTHKASHTVGPRRRLHRRVNVGVLEGHEHLRRTHKLHSRSEQLLQQLHVLPKLLCIF